jgi:hypothetical protein
MAAPAGKTLEERVRDVETTLTNYRNGFWFVLSILLIVLGVGSVTYVPAKLKDLIDAALGADVKKEAKWVDDQYTKLNNEKDGVRANLGITKLEGNISTLADNISKAVRVDRTYRIKSGAADLYVSLKRSQNLVGGEQLQTTPTWNKSPDAFWTFVQEDKP